MTQALEKWSLFEREFYRDGSLRDIYVLDATPQDWVEAARFLATAYSLRFSGGWNGATFPSDVLTLFPKTETDLLSLLSIDVCGMHVNCHFFVDDEIEFDVAPEEVISGDRLDAVFGFMKGLATAVGKDAVLTPENMRDIVIFRARPGSDLVEHSPCGGFGEV